MKNSGIWIHVNERLNILTRFLNDWDKKALAYRLEIVPREKFLAACIFFTFLSIRSTKIWIYRVSKDRGPTSALRISTILQHLCNAPLLD